MDIVGAIFLKISGLPKNMHSMVLQDLINSQSKLILILELHNIHHLNSKSVHKHMLSSQVGEQLIILEVYICETEKTREY